jgi:hypothetical protein
MDFFDFFFPEQAEAAHLRRISRNLSRSNASTGALADSARRTADEVADLRADVKFLTLVLTALLKRLAENETMSLHDLSDLLGDVDRLDGLPDEGLEPGVLRGLLGVIRQDMTPTAEPEAEQINIVTSPWRPTRYRRR